MFEFNANVFETNILNLRIVVGIVAVVLVDVLRNRVNQRRLLIRNTKLEVLEKKYELQRELESFWVFERYVVEECNFISESRKRSVEIELCRQIRDEEVQKKLYQERCDKALLAKTGQVKRLLVRNTFALAIRRAKNVLKKELSINQETYALAFCVFCQALCWLRCAIFCSLDIHLKEESNVDRWVVYFYLKFIYAIDELQPIIIQHEKHEKLNTVLASQATTFRVVFTYKNQFILSFKVKINDHGNNNCRSVAIYKYFRFNALKQVKRLSS